jgi:hypothetical protein
MNEITDQEYQTAKAIVEEYEEQEFKAFTKGKEYKQFSSGEPLVKDDNNENHTFGIWSKHFTLKPTT